MPLVRFEVKNEYGLGDPELYRAVSKKEDPKALLDGVAVAGLVGILRQLGDLAEFAADIFHDLHEQVMATSARGRKMLTRIQHIEAALPSLEKVIQGQRSHIHFSYVAGSDWHADLRTEQSHLLSSDLPRFMMDSYEECRDPPRLYLLDKFDCAGTGACLKRYSDPSYFKRVLATSELEKAEKVPRGKKARKIKRKGSRLKNGEVQHAVSLSRRNSSTRFASPSTDEQGFSTETTSISDMRLKPELPSRSTSFDSRTRLNYVEQVPDTDSSVVPDQLEFDRLSVSKLQINQSDACASDIHDEPNGIGVDDNSLHDSLQGQSVHESPPVTWDEKTEIVKPTSPKSCDDILVDSTHDSEPLPVSSEPSNVELETAKLGTLDQGDNIFDIATVLVPLSSGNHFDEITSETDNYMDALNTLESETETDSEFQTKREVKSLSNFSYRGMESGTATMQAMPAPDSDISGSDSPTGSHNSSYKDESPNTYNLGSSESLEYVQSPHTTGFAPDLDCPVGNEISENNGLDMSRMSSFEGVKGDQPPKSGICNSHTMLSDVTTNTSKSQGSPPVNTSGIPSTKFWTNGNLLGLEPSKPPDFSVSNAASEDIVSGFKNTGCDHSSYMGTTKLHYSGLAVEPETVALPNEIISNNCGSVKKIDGSSNAPCSLDQSSFCGDQCFGRTDDVGQQIDLSKYSPSCHDNQHDEPVKQNSQRNLQSLSLSEFEKIQDALSTNINAQNDGPDMTIAKGAELSGSYNVESRPNESEQNTKDISSSLSALAQRFFANSLQRNASITHADISKPSGVVNADISKPRDTPFLNKHKEGPTAVVSQTSYEQNTNEKIERGSSKNSVSSSSHYSGHSSPPLEHMKISFHPMNGLETSKLKLEFPSGNLHESIEDLMFPSFQLLPGPILPLQESGSESDDDSFCRSCPYTSEDHLSPRSDSNSELWGQDERSGSKNHEIDADLRRISLSTASVSSFKGFDQMSQIDPAIGYGNLEGENGILYFQSCNLADLPGLDSFISTKNQQGKCDSLSIDPEDSASQSLNELPPPPPLPPMQWRMMKPSFAKEEDKDSSIAEIFEHFNVLEAQRFTSHKQQEQNTPRPPPFPDAMAHPNKKTQDQQKLNGHIESKHDVSGKELDKREELLHQIRNKLDWQKLNGHMETRNSDVNSKELDGREEFLHQIRNKHDWQKLNGHREPKKNHGANDQEVDEREELLFQIKNKTFNLRRTTTAKPSLVPQSTTNNNVAAILEKANAIRQAFVGSDDGGDDENWSDG